MQYLPENIRVIGKLLIGHRARRVYVGEALITDREIRCAPVKRDDQPTLKHSAPLGARCVCVCVCVCVHET